MSEGVPQFAACQEALSRHVDEIAKWGEAYRKVRELIKSGAPLSDAYVVVPLPGDTQVPLPLGHTNPDFWAHLLPNLNDYVGAQFIASWRNAKQVCDEAVALCNAAESSNGG